MAKRLKSLGCATPFQGSTRPPSSSRSRLRERFRPSLSHMIEEFHFGPARENVEQAAPTVDRSRPLPPSAPILGRPPSGRPRSRSLSAALRNDPLPATLPRLTSSLILGMALGIPLTAIPPAGPAASADRSAPAECPRAAARHRPAARCGRRSATRLAAPPPAQPVLPPGTLHAAPTELGPENPNPAREFDTMIEHCFCVSAVIPRASGTPRASAIPAAPGIPRASVIPKGASPPFPNATPRPRRGGRCG